MGIHFFDTYVGAAVAAFEQGLISVSGLESIARKARSALVATLDKAPLTGRSGWSPEKRRAWCEMFNDDLALCNGHLPFDEIEEVPLPEVVTEAVAEAVDTLAATRDTTDALKPVESIPFSETPLPAQALPTHEAPSKAAEPSQALSAPAGAPAPATTPPVLATTVDTVSKATAELQTVVDRATEAKVAADGQAGLNETEKAAVRTEVLMAMKDVLMTLLPKRYSTASGESLPLAEAPANTTATELAGPGAAASGAGTTSTTQCGATLALDRQLGASETTQAAPADGMEPLATIHSVGDSGLLSTALTPSTTPREPGSEGEDDDIQTSVPSAPVFESITTESVPDDEGTGPVPQPEVGDSTSQLQQALAAVGEMVGMVSDLTGSTANKPEASTHTSIAETGAASPRGDETPAPGVADEDRTNTMDIPTKPSAQAGGAQPVQVDGAEKENVAEQVEVRVDTDHAAEETGQSEGAADKTNESEHEGDKVDVPIGVREAVTELAKNAVKTPEADTQP
ncbi:hypothetical protein SARC_10436 [Sphaeroforma arctica JP610]|uniref:Uncharacterized protein n=1 Tax=Sphaeroforma arctica JP610 TaxID=667725 RepID=A0A0L0FK28_9EUKA|nr:hypothetical protein SARC_10436 [Sphaeroforma arctica JP610]KNC77095.1 hypothetical protein SARC_10436 [Sphaeroforma arctica JP610]|eukprot:XP_014150997.1 hypothetical protein SARC_10436 [Sphaeroforma arctica JP610]